MARLIKVLGVWFCIDCEESKKKNYEEKVHKVEDILNNWRNKRLTSIGKIAVIKALAASQFVYILSSTTSCSKSLKETNNSRLPSWRTKDARHNRI